MRGRFITFEGVDGSGKSTQIRRLRRFLKDQGRDVVLTREPGGSPGAEEIRRLLVEGPPDRWSAETELLLFNAARRDHLERTVWPALERGAVVLCDRYVDSTRIYQGMRSPELRELADRLHAECIELEPDLTIIIDLDPDVAVARSAARSAGDARVAQETRFETRGTEFQHQLRSAYQALADEFPERCRVVAGTESEQMVFVRICQHVGRYLA